MISVTKAAAARMAAQNRPISCHSSVKVLLASFRTPRPSSNPATKKQSGLKPSDRGDTQQSVNFHSLLRFGRLCIVV